MHGRGHSRPSHLKHEEFNAFALNSRQTLIIIHLIKNEKVETVGLCRHKRTLMLPENQTAPKVSCQKEKCYVIKK